MAPPLRKITDYLWEIPQKYKPGMRVPGLVIADEVLIGKMKEDLTLEQVANVAVLPGIYKYSIVLPDGHQGYGFPIGGVAAFDANEGVLSPGGVGYDINCGVRVLATNLMEQEVRPKLRELAET
ncbi:MAG: RtcB family protein, partial [Thermofilum sp.]|nr:RtcB family protein [Thermofilum sp.]